MRVGVNPNYSNNISSSNKNQNNVLLQNNYKDSFEFSSGANNIGVVNKKNTPAFSGLFSRLFTSSIQKPVEVQEEEDSNVSEYTKKLARDLSEFMDEPVKASSLSCVLTPTQIKEILPTLKEENFDCTGKAKDSHYSIDLDYESNFSKGPKCIAQIMSEVVEYADAYSEAHNGEKFTFALTDRENLAGVRQALSMIARDPEKYKNLQFIPAVKLSFSHEAPTSPLGYENSAIIVYGINPFSQRLSSLIDTLLANRQQMLLDFIGEIADRYPQFSYDIAEFAEQNDIYYNRDFTVSNLYRKAQQYLVSKTEESLGNEKEMIPTEDQKFEEAVAAADELLSNMSAIISASSEKPVRKEKVNREETPIIKKINDVFGEYVTHEDKDGNLVSFAENLYPQIINRLSTSTGEQPIIAFETPYYLIDYFGETGENGEYPLVCDFLKKLQEGSHDMFHGLGTVGPKYMKDSEYVEPTSKRFPKGKRKEVEKFNEYIFANMKNIYPVGGSFDKAYELEEERQNAE